MQMLVHTGLLYVVTEMKLFILIVFGFEHVPEKIKEFIRNKNIKAKIFWVQANNSVMCEYFWIGFIHFMLAGKKLTDFTDLFSPHDFKKNDDIILSYFKNKWMQFY